MSDEREEQEPFISGCKITVSDKWDDEFEIRFSYKHYPSGKCTLVVEKVEGLSFHSNARNQEKYLGSLDDIRSELVGNSFSVQIGDDPVENYLEDNIGDIYELRNALA